jgi:hypothetical protein
MKPGTTNAPGGAFAVCGEMESAVGSKVLQLPQMAMIFCGQEQFERNNT